MTAALSHSNRLLAIALACATLVAIVAAVTPDAPAKKKDPKGSYTILTGKFVVGGKLEGVNLVCDSRNWRWVPGTEHRKTPKGIIFYPFGAQIRNAKAAMKREKSASKIAGIKKSIKALDSRQNKGKIRCARLKSQGAGSSANRPSYDRTVRWVPFTRSRSTCESTSAPATNELRFTVCGKEGIARVGSARRGRPAPRAGPSDVKTFDSSGALNDAVTEGSVSITTIAVGPTGWTYMGLNSAVNLSNTSDSSGTQCAFIRVREATGVPSCVDSTIRSVTEVQFDNTGRVYYRGTVGSSNALRRYADGTIDDLITSQASLGSYVALEDGAVVLSGSSAGGGWIRWLSPTLELNTIMNSTPNWMKQFPDGNVYFGVNCCDNEGPVRRFLSATKSLDPIPWVRGSCSFTNGGRTAPTYETQPGYFYTCTSAPSIAPIGECAAVANLAYCGEGLSAFSSIVITQSGTVFGIGGWQDRSRLMQMWPEVRPATTQITTVRAMKEAGDLFVITGTNSSGQFVTTAYDPATDSERILIPTSSQTEIYNLAYSSSTGEMFFEGLRFSNNSYVVGKVNVATGALTYLGTTNVSFSNFQAF